MSNTKHTPGPWQIDESDQVNYKNGIINIKQGAYLKYDSVCTIYPCRLSFEKSLANAKLIEAAPELLEALESCSEVLNILAIKLGIHAEGAPIKHDSPDDHGAINALTFAKSVIKKATQ